jgi:hypothetical protein
LSSNGFKKCVSTHRVYLSTKKVALNCDVYADLIDIDYSQVKYRYPVGECEC